MWERLFAAGFVNVGDVQNRPLISLSSGNILGKKKKSFTETIPQMESYTCCSACFAFSPRTSSATTGKLIGFSPIISCRKQRTPNWQLAEPSLLLDEEGNTFLSSPAGIKVTWTGNWVPWAAVLALPGSKPQCWASPMPAEPEGKSGSWFCHNSASPGILRAAPESQWGPSSGRLLELHFWPQMMRTLLLSTPPGTRRVSSWRGPCRPPSPWSSCWSSSSPCWWHPSSPTASTSGNSEGKDCRKHRRSIRETKKRAFAKAHQDLFHKKKENGGPSWSTLESPGNENHERTANLKFPSKYILVLSHF